MKLSVCFSMLAACAAIAMPASAGTISAQVKAADLDLATREGVETLRTRVNAAAREICAPEVLAEYVGGIDTRRCIRTVRVSPVEVEQLLSGEGKVIKLVRAPERIQIALR